MLSLYTVEMETPYYCDILREWAIVCKIGAFNRAPDKETESLDLFILCFTTHLVLYMLYCDG